MMQQRMVSKFMCGIALEITTRDGHSKQDSVLQAGSVSLQTITTAWLLMGTGHLMEPKFNSGVAMMGIHGKSNGRRRNGNLEERFVMK